MYKYMLKALCNISKCKWEVGQSSDNLSGALVLPQLQQEIPPELSATSHAKYFKRVELNNGAELHLLGFF